MERGGKFLIVIDGKHTYIGTYHIYKSRFYVVLLAVVNADYKFIYANVGVQEEFLIEEYLANQTSELPWTEIY